MIIYRSSIVNRHLSIVLNVVLDWIAMQFEVVQLVLLFWMFEWSFYLFHALSCATHPSLSKQKYWMALGGSISITNHAFDNQRREIENKGMNE